MGNQMLKLDSNHLDNGVPTKQYPWLIKAFIGGCAPKGRIQSLGTGVESLTITLSDLHGAFVLPVLAAQGSATQGSQRENTSPGGHGEIPVEG